MSAGQGEQWRELVFDSSAGESNRIRYYFEADAVRRAGGSDGGVAANDNDWIFDGGTTVSGGTLGGMDTWEIQGELRNTEISQQGSQNDVRLDGSSIGVSGFRTVDQEDSGGSGGGVLSGLSEKQKFAIAGIGALLIAKPELLEGEG